MQMLPAQHAAPAHVLPAQQRSAGPPHRRQTPSPAAAEQIVPLPQAPPVQQGSPGPPQFEHVPPEQRD
jgi:hypothetical protein